MLADRMKQMKPSGIRRIFELMASMEDPINLSIGQAHFDPPEALVEAACKAIRDGHNRYTVTQGLPELNARILDRVEARYAHRPEASLVTSGVSGGLVLGFLALLDPGDEILLPDPGFTMYAQLAQLFGAKVKFYDLYPDWQLKPDEIAALIGPRCKAILLNSPSNPTGGVLSESSLAKVAAIAAEHGAFIISDEIYDEFVYVDEYASAVGRHERVLQLSGFSKTYGVPGWRLGYATGPAELLDAMKTIQQFSFVCAPAPFQVAVAEAAFELDMSSYIREYRGKRDRIVGELHKAYQLVPPQGSFYAFPSLPGEVPEAEFMDAALAARLLVVPGSAFSRRDSHFRISFAVTDEKLGEGIRGLNDLVGQLT
jgi:aspartate aminotransferase/aminotransferase